MFLMKLLVRNLEIETNDTNIISKMNIDRISKIIWMWAHFMRNVLVYIEIFPDNTLTVHLGDVYWTHLHVQDIFHCLLI